MNERKLDRRSRHRGRRVLFGAFLMIAGGVLLADRLGVEVGVPVWRLWPFLLIGLGLLRLLSGPAEEREGGFWILLAGLYGFVGVYGIAGLGWGTAWPIFLVGAGLWMAIGGALGLGRGVARRESGDVD